MASAEQTTLFTICYASIVPLFPDFIVNFCSSWLLKHPMEPDLFSLTRKILTFHNVT